MGNPRVPPSTTRARRDETGASAVEYGLLIAGIAGVLVLAVLLLGGKVRSLFDDTCEAVGQVATSSSSCDG